MARHRERTNGWLWVLPSLLIPLTVAAAAWTFHVASEGEQIAPNVRFAGIDISGVSPEDAAAEVSEREAEFLDTPVVIDLGERQVAMTAGEAGFDYLHEETVSALVSARHSNGPLAEFVAWVTTPFDAVHVEDRFTFDEGEARQRLKEEDFVISDPVEPRLASEDGGAFYVIPGEDGVRVNVDQVVADLAETDPATGTVEVLATRTLISPTVSDDEAEDLAAEVNGKTDQGLLAVIEDRVARITPTQIRSHLTSTVEGGELLVDVDVDGLQTEFEKAFPNPIGELVPPDLEVVDGEIIVKEEGRPPSICCSGESIRAAAETMLRSGSSFYMMQPRIGDDETWAAWADGSLITEPVAEFTTEHACCENRVVNIQTIADALTGKYLIPGETLSLNEFVGPRTREKGYLPAGAIRGGHMTDEVGGGVSQFVTTIFNAAYFAGLDLDEYQSHSVYFSRYPFGREATLSIPGPDLVITNNTDYPVLIWPTYTDTSITVTLYSTDNVDVEELEQRVYARNQCRHSQIDRQRTFSDGRITVDTIVANYRPADGIDCNGRRIPET
jgi:vancomycin resistance protein YoaR